jgi:hypothetical protein
MRHLLYSGLALLVLAASGAHAASDGNLATGTSASSGSLKVGLVVEDMVRISDLDDLMLQWNSGQQAFTATDNLCVFRNLSGRYSVSARSHHGDNAFVMAGPSGSRLTYDVQWNGRSLTPENRSGVINGAHQTAPDCAGNGNTTLKVRSTPEQVSAASRTGTHTDTLTLEIIAE